MAGACAWNCPDRSVLRSCYFHMQVVYSFTDALRWMIQLAEGLAYLHSHKPLIIHRDLKLENCLLTGAVLAFC